MEVEEKKRGGYRLVNYGWNNIDKQPPAFELLKLQTNYRVVIGWWTGQDWFIRNTLPDEKVTSWKKHFNYYPNT